MKNYVLLFFTFCFLSSCIMQAPKYAGIEQVLSLKVGMTKKEVSDSLGIPPYDIKSVTDSTSKLIYKYRTTDRKTPPLLMKKTNGKNVTGKWGDLFVTYNKKDVVIDIESCSQCGDKIQGKKINYAALLQVVETVGPSILIYFGLIKTK